MRLAAEIIRANANSATASVRTPGVLVIVIFLCAASSRLILSSAHRVIGDNFQLLACRIHQFSVHLVGQKRQNRVRAFYFLSNSSRGITPSTWLTAT